jgi:hypothetical protein
MNVAAKIVIKRLLSIGFHEKDVRINFFRPKFFFAAKRSLILALDFVVFKVLISIGLWLIGGRKMEDGEKESIS